MSIHSIGAQVFRGVVSNNSMRVNIDEENSGFGFIPIALIAIALLSIVWGSCKLYQSKKERIEEMPIRERYREVKRQLNEERTKPTQTLHRIDRPIIYGKQDNYFTCTKKRTQLLHKMAVQIFSQVGSKEKTIRALAKEVIKCFMEEGNQKEYDLRFLLRMYAFNVFSGLFSGSSYIGYSSFVVENVNSLFDHEDKKFNNKTFIGYMRGRPKQFTPLQIRGTLLSLILGMDATMGDAMIVLLNQWVRHPSYVQKLRLIRTEVEWQHEFDKQMLESMRMLPPPGTASPRGISLFEFQEHSDIVGSEPERFMPERFDNKALFKPKEVSCWRRSPTMPFSRGPNACPGDRFAQPVITIFFRVFLEQCAFRVVDDPQKKRHPRETKGFEVKRKEEVELGQNGWI